MRGPCLLLLYVYWQQQEITRVWLRMRDVAIIRWATVVTEFWIYKRSGSTHAKQSDPISIRRSSQFLVFRERVPLLVNDQASDHCMSRKTEGNEGRDDCQSFRP